MFTEKELVLLHYLSRGVNGIQPLTERLDISVPEVYRIVRSLKRKEALDDSRGIHISSCPFAKRLMMIMSEGKGLARFFKDKRLIVLLAIAEPKKLNDIVDETKLSETYIRKILRIQMEGGLVREDDGIYSINDGLYPKVRPFLLSYKDHLEVFDIRAPRDADILYKDDDRVIYSSPYEEKDPLTGFSAFGEFNFETPSDDLKYYSTSDKEKDINTVFSDAYIIASNKDSWRLKMFLELFYIKYEQNLEAPQTFVSIHKRILSGEKVKGWPSYADLKDRMWMVTE